MLDLEAIDVEEIANALADQSDYEHRWLIDPRTGEVAFWTSDLGIDGENPVELDELDLILIDPLPPYVWYQDMVDFSDGISDRSSGERLRRSLEGKGAFRRFKNALYQQHPDLISAWHTLRDARAGRRRAHRRRRRPKVPARPPRARPAVRPSSAKSGQIRVVLPASYRRRSGRHSTASGSTVGLGADAARGG